MFVKGLKAGVDRDFLMKSYSVFFYNRGQHVRPVLVNSVEGAPINYEDLLCVEESCCQDLINDLWRLGFRPHKDIASAGQLEAMTAHIQDLRDVIFKKL